MRARVRSRLRGRVGVRGFLRPRFRLPFPFRALRGRRVDLVLALVVATLALVAVRGGDDITRGMVLGGEL